jgi:cell division transport system permease protein
MSGSLATRVACLLRTAVRGLAASPVTSAIAVVTIGVSLVLVGAFALLAWNMEELLRGVGDELRVTAYLEEGIGPERQRELAASALTVEGVAEVRIVSKEEALERFRSGVGRGGAFLEGLDENPLPASLEISLAPASRSSEGMRRVVGSLEGLPGIDDLGSGQDWVEGYLRAIALVRGMGMGLGAILALAALLIVANTIRLAVLARRDELEILALVGASRAFVATPFLLEGAAQGAAGGVLALVVLGALFRLVLPELEFGLELVLGGVQPRFFAPGEAAALLAAGAGLGLVGSGAALSGSWRA